MPRPPRASASQGPYHVTARGNRGQAIFVEDRDRAQFLDRLGHVAAQRHWKLHAYCLMTNHYHLVLETPHLDLSSGMQRLNAAYAQWFNRRHDVSGHLFRHRFYAGLVQRDAHLAEVLRYLALNPVRGGLCANPADWPWSSYRFLLSQSSSRPLLSTGVLALFGRDSRRAREAFRAFVEASD